MRTWRSVPAFLCAWAWGGCSGPRSTRRLRIVSTHGRRASQVRKHRLFYAPLLVWLGGPLVSILDTGVRVLPQRDWEDRERRIYRSLYGTSIRIDADGTLVLPYLAGETLATLLEDPELEESIRKTRHRTGGRRARRVPSAGIHPRRRHGRERHGRSSRLESLAGSTSRPFMNRVARWPGDVPTTCEHCSSPAWSEPFPKQFAETLQLILDVYADEDVTRVLATSFTSVFRRPLDLPPRPGGVVVSVFPGDRPAAALAPRRVAPPFRERCTYLGTMSYSSPTVPVFS